MKNYYADFLQRKIFENMQVRQYQKYQKVKIRPQNRLLILLILLCLA